MADYRSIGVMRQLARDAGSHWFDRDSMRFFNSKVHGGGTVDPCGGAVFVSSEQYVDNRDSRNNGKRLFSVRRQDAKGNVRTIGEFQGHRTLEAARKAARAAVGSCGGKKKRRKL